MSAGHTPGPWKVSEDDGSAALFVFAPVDAYAVCRVSSSVITEKNRADARLIAAAPDMLEALRMLVADFGDYPASERPCLAFDKARAAIAKALGQEGGAL